MGRASVTPELHLTTLFELAADGRIVSTREPGASRGPLFSLVRGATSNAWAVRADVAEDVAGAIDSLARREPPAADLRSPPAHAQRYEALLLPTLPAGAAIRSSGSQAFAFPAAIPAPAGTVVVVDEALLQRHFPNWVAGELATGRAPLAAVCEDGYPVSICFCARSSDAAAEAGVETAVAFRGRGYAARATAAWALAVRSSGRIPLYSTHWTNGASLAVARQLGLRAYASGWSVSERNTP